jgi:hypothetical protein
MDWANPGWKRNAGYEASWVIHRIRGIGNSAPIPAIRSVAVEPLEWRHSPAGATSPRRGAGLRQLANAEAGSHDGADQILDEASPD